MEKHEGKDQNSFHVAVSLRGEFYNPDGNMWEKTFLQLGFTYSKFDQLRLSSAQLF